MATFMQWRRRRPDESDDIAIWNVLTPTRLVLTTGSQLDFALYVDDWWRHNYRRQPGVAEYEVIGAEDEDLWETVFRPVTDVNRHKVVCIYDGHAIDNKDAGKFEGFLGRDDLKNSHLVIREHVDGKVDSMQAKYRPFIGRKNAKFITCSPLSIKDQVELVNIELGVTGTLAKYFVEFCGSDKAVFC
jgi:hypothetical protein